jgi:hypothetical protein
MHLSEAILLGYPEIRHTNLGWLHQNADGSCDGCAIGAALWAVGRRQAFTREELRGGRNAYALMSLVLAKHWPWTAKYPRLPELITDLFSDVQRGDMTIEQLADRVRELETQDSLGVSQGEVKDQLETVPYKEEVHAR